jgi:hypothetical protein
MHRTRLPMLLMSAVALVLAACEPAPTTTTTTAPIVPGPKLFAFQADVASGSGPLSTALRWSINSPEGRSLTCTLDYNGDSIQDETIASCTSATIRLHSYTTVGTTHSWITVTDSAGMAAVAVTDINVTSAPAEPFDVTLSKGPMSSEYSSAFDSAAARWEQVIGAGISATPLSIGADECADGQPAWSGIVDDVVISAVVEPIDGYGGTLGMAGPCIVRSSSGLPAYGVMIFDSADMANLAAAGTLTDTILHEMCHVLGFGTIWDSQVSGLGSSDPRWGGALGNAAWASIGGPGAVPIEAGGGSGTAYSHWRESSLHNELMTGYVDASNPASIVTIATMADLGYRVDVAQADPYGLSALRRSQPPSAPPAEAQLIKPVGSV